MSIEVQIWHYPRCSKSRKTLAILRDEEAQITVRRYQDDPPTVAELAAAVDALGIAPKELVRTKESLYRDMDLDAEALSDQDWLELLAAHPKLIERPVVLSESGAVIGRPPEKVYEILPAASEA